MSGDCGHEIDDQLLLVLEVMMRKRMTATMILDKMTLGPQLPPDSEDVAAADVAADVAAAAAEACAFYVWPFYSLQIPHPA